MRLNKINKLKNGNLLFVYTPEHDDEYFRFYVMKPGSLHPDNPGKLNRDNVITNTWRANGTPSLDMFETLGIKPSDIIIERI